jgi:hypothetical protein
MTVVSSFPLGEIIQCREASGRIAKWVVEIMGEIILFAPWKAIKSQVLAGFVAEWVDTQCRRFDPGGSLDRRVNCRRVSQPRWVGASGARKGE